MREIVFDTETTGFNYSGGDRIVELGCVELVNHTPTGKVWQTYLDPEREVPEDSFRVHGLSTQFLAGKPKFSEIADEFLGFIGDAKIVAHNAKFDFDFVNFELERAGRAALEWERIVDTLSLSRVKNPQFGSHSLDALCKRYEINNSHRDLHGALLDARLTAEVYIELLGGKEVDFFISSDEGPKEDLVAAVEKKNRPYRPSRAYRVSDIEMVAHSEFIKSLGEHAIWAKL